MSITDLLPSIRTGLTRSVMAISVAGGLFLAVTVGVMLHEALDDLLDGGLQESAEVLYGVLSLGDGVALEQQGMLPAPPHDEGLVWQLVGGDGRVSLRSHRAPVQPLTPGQVKGFTDTRSWRIYSLPLEHGRGVLHVAQPEQHRHQAQVLTIGGSLGLALLIGLCAMVWLNVRLRTELKPLQELSSAVARFDPLQPGSKLPQPARAELAPMVTALDDLGQRLLARVAHERAFAAHAAHALRTPLAGIDAQLAVAIREAPEAMQPRLRQTREAAARLRSVVSALISLFRAGGQMRWQQVSLEQLVADLPVRGVAVSVNALQPIWCDPDLLSAAVLNLLDNAARHHASQVTVDVQQMGDRTCIDVRDNGEGMTGMRLRQVQQALQTGQGEGVLGLGLTLVDLVARNHGGQVSLSCRGSGADQASGCVVSLTLARTPPAA